MFLVYRQDVNNLCSAPIKINDETFSTSPNENEKNTIVNSWFTSLLILVPLRLGLDELDLIYESYLKEALKLPQTVGIIGGSPRHAVYILGFQDESFIDLDPHFSQNTVNVLEETFDLSVSQFVSLLVAFLFESFQSYSCSSPKRLTAKKLDPSCTLGFYCRDKADFEMFCAQVRKKTVYSLKIENHSFVDGNSNFLLFPIFCTMFDELISMEI